MQVVLESGEHVGTRVAVFELPQGFALDVTRESGTVLIPFNAVFIHEMDRAARDRRDSRLLGLLD